MFLYCGATARQFFGAGMLLAVVAALGFARATTSSRPAVRPSRAAPLMVMPLDTLAEPLNKSATAAAASNRRASAGFMDRGSVARAPPVQVLEAGDGPEQVKQAKETMDTFITSFPNAFDMIKAGVMGGTLAVALNMVTMVNESLDKCLQSFKPILGPLQKAWSELWLFIEQQFAPYLEDTPAAKAQKAKVLVEANDEVVKTTKLLDIAQARLAIAATDFKEAVEPDDVNRTAETLKAANKTVAKWTLQLAVALETADELKAAEAVREAKALQVARARAEMAQAKGLAAPEGPEIQESLAVDSGEKKKQISAGLAAEMEAEMEAEIKENAQRKEEGA